MYEFLDRLFDKLTLAMTGAGLTAIVVMVIIVLIAWIRR